MIKRILPLIITVLTTFSLFGQEENIERRIIDCINLYNFNKAKKILKSNKTRTSDLSPLVQLIFEWEIGFLTTNNLNPALNAQIKQEIKNSTSFNNRSWFNLQQGDFTLNDNPSNFSLAYNLYKGVYEEALQEKDSILICEALKRILFYGSKYSRNIDDLEAYGNMFYKYAYNDNEKAVAIYRILAYETQKVSKFNYEIRQGLKERPKDTTMLHLDFQKIEEGIYLAKQSANQILEANFIYMSALNYNLHLGKADIAYKNYHEAFELFNKFDFAYANGRKFDALLSMGALNYLKSEYIKAESFFNQASKIKLPKQEIRDIQSLNHWRYSNYEGMGETDSAYKYLKIKNGLEKRINQVESNIAIQDIEVKYQTAEKEKQILKEQQRATTNRNWLVAAGLALLFGAGIAILLQKNTTKKRKLAEQETLIKQQKVETLLKEQELVSIDAMIAGQEKERTKVANELHDDLGSLMATVKLHFDNVKVDQKDPALKNAQKLLDEAYQKIRGMAHSKNSGVMANQGLLPAVKKMAKTISETNALKVTVEDFGLGERMENSLELSIFRIIQELSANIIKHAGASKATIQFTQHEDKLNIIVEDNGKGFDMSTIKRETSGMGLGTIEKRIEYLGGTFTVDSVLRKGTSILIDIPV